MTAPKLSTAIIAAIDGHGGVPVSARDLYCLSQRTSAYDRRQHVARTLQRLRSAGRVTYDSRLGWRIAEQPPSAAAEKPVMCGEVEAGGAS